MVAGSTPDAEQFLPSACNFSCVARSFNLSTRDVSCIKAETFTRKALSQRDMAELSDALYIDALLSKYSAMK